MTDPELSVLVDAGERMRVAVRPFLHDGRLTLVVVAKVVLDLSEQGPAKWIEAAPIAVSDLPFRETGLASIDRADEVALGKSACDVTLIGSVVAPFGRPALSLNGRLALFRDGATVLDKSIVARGGLDASGRPCPIASLPLVWEHAYGGPGAGRAAGEQNPVGTDRPMLVDPTDPQRPAGFGPIGARWPSRAGRIGSQWLSTLESGLPEIGASFPWGYFQSAPRDLQVPFLEGDEWIVLEGFNAKSPSIRSRLPWLKARAYVVDANGYSHLPLALDTLAIDANRLRASVIYRGMFTPASPLTEIALVARVAAGSEPPPPADKASIFARARPLALTMPKAPTRGPKLSETVTPSELVNAPNAGAPFALAKPPSDRGGATPRSSVAPWREVSPHVAPASGTARTMALVGTDLVREGMGVRLGAAPRAPTPEPSPAPIPPSIVPRVAFPAAPAPPGEPLEPEPEAYEITPPSRAALAAHELRAMGMAEEHVQRIMADFGG